MPLDYQKNLCFIHIPKTGGTGIEMQLQIMNKKKNLWGKHKGRARQHYLWFEYKKVLNNDYKNFFKFALIRNPYSRFISEYYYSSDFGFKNHQSFDDFIKTAKDIGIINAAIFPVISPGDSELPTIRNIPEIAKMIEVNVIAEIFSFKKKYPKIARNNIWSDIIKFVFATVVLYMAKT